MCVCVYKTQMYREKNNEEEKENEIYEFKI